MNSNQESSTRRYKRPSNKPKGPRSQRQNSNHRFRNYFRTTHVRPSSRPMQKQSNPIPTLRHVTQRNQPRHPVIRRKHTHSHSKPSTATLLPDTKQIRPRSHKATNKQSEPRPTLHNHNDNRTIRTRQLPGRPAKSTIMFKQLRMQRSTAIKLTTNHTTADHRQPIQPATAATVTKTKSINLRPTHSSNQ